MKKLTCLLLACLMTISLVACGNETPDTLIPDEETEITQPITSETPENPTEESTPAETPTGIRENGNIPSGKSEWTEEEKKYIREELYDKIVQAIIDLDIATLEQYVEESDLYELKAIENNPEFKEMYKNTYGKMIYLPDSGYMLVKSTRYTYSTWYTAFYLTNGVMPANLNELTKENVNSVYLNIYENAPYEAVKFERKTSAIEIVDGYIKYDIQPMLYDIDHFELWALSPSAYENPYAKYIFGDEFEVKPNYNILGEHRDILEATYNFDTDAILAYLEKHCSTDSTATGKFVLGNWRNTDNHAKMKEWFENNCHVTVSGGSMHIFYITDSIDIMKTHFPFYSFTDSDIEMLRELNIKYSDWEIVSEEDQYIYTQRDLLSLMEEDGLIDR